MNLLLWLLRPKPTFPLNGVKGHTATEHAEGDNAEQTKSESWIRAQQQPVLNFGGRSQHAAYNIIYLLPLSALVDGSLFGALLN